VLLSQEWEVMVEPSAEANRPTMMLVQESNSRLTGFGRVRGFFWSKTAPAVKEISKIKPRPEAMNHFK